MSRRKLIRRNSIPGGSLVYMAYSGQGATRSDVIDPLGEGITPDVADLDESLVEALEEEEAESENKGGLLLIALGLAAVIFGS